MNTWSRLLPFAAGLALGSLATAGTALKPSAETLLTTGIAATDDIEIIVQRVELPPHQSLPRHTHPGEEFVVVIDGTAVVAIDGEPDVPLSAGQAFKIAPGKVHTGKTGDQAATALVFRVHPKGQPVTAPAP